MDFNKLKSMGQSALGGMGGNNNNNTNTNTNQQDPSLQQQGGQASTGQTATGNTAAASGSEDYGDKGLDFIEKKTGYVQSRETNEKITDGARGLYEKFSGSKIDPKYSN